MEDDGVRRGGLFGPTNMSIRDDGCDRLSEPAAQVIDKTQKHPLVRR